MHSEFHHDIHNEIHHEIHFEILQGISEIHNQITNRLGINLLGNSPREPGPMVIDERERLSRQFFVKQLNIVR